MYIGKIKIGYDEQLMMYIKWKLIYDMDFTRSEMASEQLEHEHFLIDLVLLVIIRTRIGVRIQLEIMHLIRNIIMHLVVTIEIIMMTCLRHI
jgi:hypothetical protein